MTPTLLIVNAMFPFWSVAPCARSASPCTLRTPLPHRTMFYADPSSDATGSDRALLNHHSFPDLAEFLRQFGQRLVEIGDQTVVGDLENRRLLVLVDGNYHLGVLHASEVLDRARDADCDIKLGRHHLP